MTDKLVINQTHASKSKQISQKENPRDFLYFINHQILPTLSGSKCIIHQLHNFVNIVVHGSIGSIHERNRLVQFSGRLLHHRFFKFCVNFSCYHEPSIVLEMAGKAFQLNRKGSVFFTKQL